MRRDGRRIKLSKLAASRAAQVSELVDGRLLAAHRGDGESARAFSQAEAKSSLTMVVVSDRMAGRDGAS